MRAVLFIWCQHTHSLGMYDGDSFLTLSVFGQIGLVIVSLCMFGGLVWTMSHLSLHWALRVLVACISFWLFVWLSPQIYYLYYIIIIDGLPLQWVIQSPPAPFHMIRLLAFSSDDTLSAHSQALLGWVMIAAAAIRR